MTAVEQVKSSEYVAANFHQISVALIELAVDPSTRKLTIFKNMSLRSLHECETLTAATYVFGPLDMPYSGFRAVSI
jgi:hypothetical protein